MCALAFVVYGLACPQWCGRQTNRGTHRASERGSAHGTIQEKYMSQSFKTILAVGLFAVLGACASAPKEDEFIVVDPEPISVEPVYTGKYK